MKNLTKILTVVLLIALCVSLFTVQAFALNETIVDHKSAQPATCTVDGWEEYWLDEAGNYYTSNPDKNGDGKVDDTNGIASAIPSIPAGHDLVDVAAKDATCMAEGNTAHKKCTKCGQLFDTSDAETTWDAVKIAKVSHKGVDASKHAAVPPTCGEDGSLLYYICQWCGEPIAAQESTSTMSTTVDPATGAHTYGAWTTVTEATETKGGTEKRVCSVCGDEEYRDTSNTGVSGEDIWHIIPVRDTYFRGEEELPMVGSNLIQALNDASGLDANYIGLRIGTDQSLYANYFDTFDFWSWDNIVEFGKGIVDQLDAGTYYVWVFDKRNPEVHTKSIPFYIVDTPTLEPINTDKHVVNSTKNLRFRASEPVKPGSVKVGGKTLWDENYYYVSNDGLTITLSPDFLNDRQVGTYTISANTVAGNTKVSCPFYILSTANASASPKTGDESQIGLWAALILLSGAAIVVLVPKIRKHGA